jgi:hypothetical protein
VPGGVEDCTENILGVVGELQEHASGLGELRRQSNLEEEIIDDSGELRVVDSSSLGAGLCMRRSRAGASSGSSVPAIRSRRLGMFVSLWVTSISP